MKEILAEYREARAKQELAKAAYKQAYAIFKEAENKLATHLVDQGIRNTTDEQGRQYRLRPAFFYRKGKEMVERTLAWLEKRGQDPEQYWSPKLETKRLTEYLKQIYEDEGKAPLPDSEHGVPQWFSLDTTPTISVLGWKEDDEDDE
jgi:hypothetical protein